MPSLIVMLGLDGRSFAGNLNKAQVLARTAGKNISDALGPRLAGLVGAAALTKLTRDTIEFASKLDDLSGRLGIGTDRLQEFNFAAIQTGSDLDTFASFLERVNVARSEALKGNEKTLKSFAALGVSIDHLKSKRVDELAKQIGNVVKGSDVQTIIAPLRQVGGKAAGELVGAFKYGLDQAAEDIRDAGLMMGDETIAGLSTVGDFMDVFGLQLMTELAPAIVFTANAVNKAVQFILREATRLGALSSQTNLGKIAQTGLPHLGSPGFAAFKMLAELSRQVGAASPEADKAVEAIDLKFQKQLEAIMAARAARLSGMGVDLDEDAEKEKKKKATKARSGQTRDVNELQRIGAFIANPNQTLEGLQRENNQLQKQIARDIRTIASNRTSGRRVLYS